MSSRITQRLSFANVMSCIAVFIALGGSAYAVIDLRKNQVRSKHIKNGQVKRADLRNNAVISKKVKDGSLLAQDFAAGQLPDRGAVGPQGPAGPKGDTGTAGAQGSPGVNGADGTSTGRTHYAEVLDEGQSNGIPCGSPAGPSITFDVPAGAYAQIMAQADIKRGSAGSGIACVMIDGVHTTSLTQTAVDYTTFYLAGDRGSTATAYHGQPVTIPLAAGSHTVALAYQSSGGTAFYRNRKLWVTVFHPAS